MKKILFIEGKDLQIIQNFAREHSFEYRILSRNEQDLFLGEFENTTPGFEELAKELPSVQVWSFDLMEEK